MAENLKVLIADDEPPARENIIHLLLQNEPRAQILEAENGIEAARLLGEMKPDLLFLDIQMPGIDGLQLMDFLPFENRPVTVFVTAHREFAVEAFDLAAVDYLVKPFRRERFEQTMRRVKQKLAQVNDWAKKNLPSDLGDNCLHIKDGNRHIFVTIGDVSWVSSAGNYVEIHTEDGTHLMRTTMKELCGILHRHHFLRIHRAILVNRSRIRQVIANESGDYWVHLQCGKRLPMSRRRKQALRQLLGGGV